MRVLMFSWEYPPYVVGGLGNHVAALVPALARQGVEVHLVTPRWVAGDKIWYQGSVETVEGAQEVIHNSSSASVTERTPEGAYIHRVEPPVHQMGNFYADAQQTNLNLEEVAMALIQDLGGVDLLHAHDWLVAFAATSLKRLCKIPLIATIHATERGRGRGQLSGDLAHAINGTEWWLCYEAWRVITCSRYMAREVMDYFQVPADKIDVIPNGVDTAPFDALEGVDLSEFRARFALPWEKIVFHVGRIVYEKGTHLLVEAAPRVLAAVPEAKFVIAGRGPMLGDLQRRAQELGVGEKVLFAGFISDDERNRLYRVADCAVFPSLYEPFGIVALEAMAARCPVVVSSVGGLAEVVELHRTGITVYPDNVDSLTWGIVHTLQHPDWSRARAENAYRMVREVYNWDRIARLTQEVYERVVRERQQVDW